ncbi:MAG: carboxylate--amine ligase, partial [Spirochaetia bacterium]|nr:carboxylate--amine ligase [Spirochaetia bacterium]
MKFLPVAILYQAAPVPVKKGIARPMKPGGYSDGGADIACALKENEIEILTPVDSPDEAKDLDWVFPDTVEGIQSAL